MQRRKEEERGGKVITISTGTIFRTLLILLAVYFLYVIRDIVALFLVALFLAVVIDPLADTLARLRVPRGLAVAILYLLGLGALAVLLVLAIPPMFTELTQLAVTFGPYLAETRFSGIQDIVASGTLSAEGLGALATTIQQSGVWDSLPQIGSAAAGAFGGLLAFFLVLILAYYMVVEERVMLRGIAALTPAEYQPFVTQLSTKMRDKVGYWLRGQLAIMLVIALLDYAILSALGVPYALVLALFAGLMEIVPFIGPNVAVIPAVVIAFSVSPVHAALVMAAYFVVQQIESNILTPKIMQRATGLNPIVTILAILMGFQVGGIVGALLAIPIAMVASVFMGEVFRHRAIDA